MKMILKISKPALAVISLLFMWAVPVKSQVSLLAMQPMNQFSFDDLWNLTISINQVNEYEYFYLTMELSENQRGTVLTSKTNQFHLNSGANLINRNNCALLKPMEINYVSMTEYKSETERGGKFPAGKYHVSFKLYGLKIIPETGKKLLLLAENEYNTETDFLFPLMLVYVYDKDSISEKNPTFTWTPPFPLPDGEKLSYQIKIVEILPGQSPYSAITSNGAIILEKGISNSFYPYPVGARDFEIGHSYCWQVIAMEKDNTVCSSEVWSFVFDKKKEQEKKKKKEQCQSYPELRKTIDGKYYFAYEDTLKFVYNETYFKPTDAVLTFKIYDSKNSVVVNSEKIREKLPVKKGTNYYALNTGKGGIKLNKGYYILEIINDKKERFYLRFYVSKENKTLKNNKKQGNE